MDSIGDTAVDFVGSCDRYSSRLESRWVLPESCDRTAQHRGYRRVCGLGSPQA